MTGKPQLHYFKSVNGVTARYGTDSYIGARRGPKGFVVNRDAVVVIPHAEFRQHRKAYGNALRNKDIERVDEAAYDAYQAKRKADAEAKAKQAKEDKAAADKVAADKVAADKAAAAEAEDNTETADAGE